MKKYLLTILLPFFLFGCAQSTPQETTSETFVNTEELKGVHTAENSLSWNGIYGGIFPCADCEGINTQLVLNRDYTYELEEKYLKNGVIVYSGKSHGTFSFDKTNTSLIRLDANADHRVFFVGEGYVQQRDKQTGQPLSENLPYRLEQMSVR